MRFKCLLAFLCFFVFPTLAHAQDVKLLWDYDKPLTEVQTYTQSVSVDNVAVTTAPTCAELTAGKTTCEIVAPGLATGTHDVRIQAQKAGVVSEAHISALNIENNAPDVPGGTRVKITVEVRIGS